MLFNHAILLPPFCGTFLFLSASLIFTERELLLFLDTCLTSQQRCSQLEKSVNWKKIQVHFCSKRTGQPSRTASGKCSLTPETYCSAWRQSELTLTVLCCLFAGLYPLVVNYSDSVEPLNCSCQISMIIFLVFTTQVCTLRIFCVLD